MTKQNEEEYVSYADRVESAKAQYRQDALKDKQKRGEGIPLVEPQVRWAEATIPLIDNESFKVYLELEKAALSNALRGAYVTRNANPKMSYGENMSYNEGYYAGLTQVKVERENIWNKYLEMLKNKQEKKNED